MALPLHTFQFEGCNGHQFPEIESLLQPGEYSRTCLLRLIDKYLWAPELIIREAIPYAHESVPEVGGIYFLVHGAQIVYVGVSGCLAQRVSQHQENRMPFDRYWCFGGMPEAFVPLLEAFYIEAINPPLNAAIAGLSPDYLAVLTDLRTGKRKYTRT